MAREKWPMGFEHSDKKIELKPVQKKLDHKIESSEGGREILSEGLEKVKIEPMDGGRGPKYEMDMYVIRARVSSEYSSGRTKEPVKIYIGKNELEAKARMLKGHDERQDDDGDQRDWVEVGDDGSLTIHDWPDGHDYLSITAKATGRIKHLAKKFGVGKE